MAFLALLAAVSCSPSRYMIDVEMRYKSKAGVDLTGKNVAVVYETALSRLQMDSHGISKLTIRVL